MTDTAAITEPRQLYSVKEFCRRNSIGKTTFWALVKTGAVETVKVGSHTLVPADSERTWHTAIRKSPTHSPTHGSAPNSGELKRTAANLKSA